MSGLEGGSDLDSWERISQEEPEEELEPSSSVVATLFVAAAGFFAFRV